MLLLRQTYYKASENFYNAFIFVLLGYLQPVELLFNEGNIFVSICFILRSKIIFLVFLCPTPPQKTSLHMHSW